MKMLFHRFEIQAAFIGNLLIAALVAHQTSQILFSTREPCPDAVWSSAATFSSDSGHNPNAPPNLVVLNWNRIGFL
jgi:hypothetical protein